jgi:hypothetical protein
MTVNSQTNTTTFYDENETTEEQSIKPIEAYVRRDSKAEEIMRKAKL